MTAQKPATQPGELVRAYRKRKRAPMRMAPEMLGFSKEKLGYIERGYDDGREPYDVSDDDLAVIARAYGIPAGELDRIGRREAAEVLRGLPPESPAGPSAGEAGPDFDRLIRALTEGRPDAETLWFLAHATDGEGRLLPFGERVGQIARWVGDRPAGETGLKPARPA